MPKMRKREKLPVRFAVGSATELRSSIWHVWTHGKEIYISTRVMGGMLKASLHYPDDWRIAWTRESGVISLRGRTGRTEERWKRPAEFTPGWTQCPSILVPWTSVPRPFSAPEAAGRGRIDWFDRPEPGYKVAFTPLIAAPGVDDPRPIMRGGDVVITPDDLKPLALTTGEHVWVCMRREPMQRIELDDVQYLVDDLAIHSGGQVDFACLVGVVDMAGQPAFLDIALGHDHVNRRVPGDVAE